LDQNPLQPQNRDLLRDQLLNYLIKKAVEALFKEVSFLSWGPLAFIAKYIVEKVVIQIVDLSILGSMIAYIRYDVTGEVNELNDLVKQIELKISAGAITDEEIKEYDERIKDVGSDLIRFGLRPEPSK
jgi:hypothetical protein